MTLVFPKHPVQNQDVYFIIETLATMRGDMAKFKAFSRNNPCPVCDDTKGKCKELESDGVLCMSFPLGEGAGAYGFIKTTANGLWGVYYPQGLDDGNSEAWKERREKRAARDAELARQHEDNSLSADDRHIEIEKVLGALSLRREHKEYLEGRGIPAIIVAHCRSIDKFQKMGIDVHVKLPGTSPYGNGLLNGHSGILVPTKDHLGRFTVMRLHDPEASQTGNPKYCVLSSRKRQVIPNLPNGEYPVAVHYPSEIVPTKIVRVGLCEGMEWKSAIAANRLGYPVIGFSGHSQMARSPLQIQEATEYIKALYGADSVELVLIPDAGCLENDSVMESLSRVLSKYPAATVTWWGQFSKPDGDIDEVSSLDKLEYLSREIFLGLKKTTPNLKERVLAGCRALYSKLNQTRGNKSRIKGTISNNKKFVIWDGATIPEAMDGNELRYDNKQRARLYEAICRSPYKYVLDLSGTGTGKSHSVGEIDPNACLLRKSELDTRMARVIYAHPNYRNPSIEAIEEDYHEDTSRHLGLRINPDKRTAKGEMWRHPLRDGEEAVVTPATCKYSKLFLEAREQGHDPEGICNGCEFKTRCAKESGDGYGFKYLKLLGQKQQRLRTCLQGLTPAMMNDQTFLIADEIEQLQWTKNISITTEDIIGFIELIIKHDASALEKLNTFLMPLMVLVNADKGKFGWQHTEIVEKLGEKPANIDELIFLAEKIEFMSMPMMTELIGKKDNKLGKKFVSDLLKCWKGGEQFVFSAHEKKLVITRVDDRMVDSIKACNTFIAQDATASPARLAMRLGVKPEDILVIRSTADIPSNLTIVHYQGAGNFSNNRSEDQQRKANIIRQHLRNKYSNVGFIDYKKYAEPGDLTHFVDGRGSNDFKDCTATASFGIPAANLSAVHIEYQLFAKDYFHLDQDNEDFSRYYSHQLEAEALQECNRLRAGLRPHIEVFHHVFSDQDLSFFEGLGYKLIVKDVSEIDNSLLSVQERTELFYLSAVQELIKQAGENLKLKDVASHLGKSLSALSLFVKRYLARNGKQGGWKDFILLMNALITGNIEVDTTEEESEMVDSVAECLADAMENRLVIGGDGLVGLFVDYMVWFQGFKTDFLILLSSALTKLSAINRGRMLAYLIPMF